MIPQPDGWLRQVTDIARSHGALLIADEVMTGFGRTGLAEEKGGKGENRNTSPEHNLSSADGTAATGLKIYNAVQPFTDDKPAIKWDGEWHLTIEVFRDLGLCKIRRFLGI